MKEKFMSDALYDEKITDNEEIDNRIKDLIFMIRNTNNDSSVDQFKKLESRIYKMENEPTSRQLRRST